MSSPEGSTTAEAVAARCLLCSVGCPVRALRVGPDQFVPDYVPHAGYVGLCGRGSVLVEWLDHPDRLRQARRSAGGGRSDGGGGTGRTLPLKDAARRMADAVRGAESAVIVADGNLDVDTLAAVGRFARDAGARWTACVTPGDAGLVHGLDASRAELVGPEALAEADAMLIVGDVFAAQPVASHWIYAARDAHPRMPRLVIAGANTATAKFATGQFEPVLGDGSAAAAVAAVRTGSTGGLPADARGLAGWKQQLAAGQHPAIVVTAEGGYGEARALAGAVAALAAEMGAMICPLTACGNAWGAMRASAAEGGACPAEILRPGADVVLAIGCDLVSAYGLAVAGPLLDAARHVIYVGPMPNRTSDRASLVIPSAFAFEAPGRALLGSDRLVAFGPLMPPPAGVPTVREILALAGAAGATGATGAPADVSAPCKAPQMPPSSGGRAGDGKGLMVAPASDPVHFGDGSLTGRAAWPRAVRPRPVLALAESDAEAAGLTDGHTAVVDGPGGSAEVEVVIRPDQRAGQATVTGAFAAVRDAFGWSWDGVRPGEAVRMQVHKP